MLHMMWLKSPLQPPLLLPHLPFSDDMGGMPLPTNFWDVLAPDGSSFLLASGEQWMAWDIQDKSLIKARGRRDTAGEGVGVEGQG